MSDSSNTNAQQGLGKSAPLVKVENVHSGVRTSATQGITNHPLAQPTPAAATATNPSVELSEKGSTTAPAASPPPAPTVVNNVSPPKAPTVAKMPPIKSTPPPKKQASSLDEMADEFLSQTSDSNPVPMLKPKPLPKEQEGIERLRTLVVRRAWGDVLSVCGQMLRGPTSPYTQLYSCLISNEDTTEVDITEFTDNQKLEVVEILTLECHAWLKLRRYNELGREVDKWRFLNTDGDSASNPTLSWVPWSLHILAAESLQYSDPSSSRCTDVLFSLRDTLVEKKQTMWLMDVDNALVNTFIRRKDWRLACASLDSMMQSIPEAVTELSDATDDTTTTTCFQCEVFSRQGRLMLQIGALAEAATLFEECKTKWNDISSNLSSSHWIFDYMPIQIRVNDGLLAFSQAQYDTAMTHFRKAIEMLQAQENIEVYYREDWMGPTVLRADAYSSLLSNCWNNMALCALYTCRMQDAVKMMENLIRQNPSFYLTERLAFNLSTLYELGSDAAASTRKKRILQLIAKRFFLHDIGPESFRVN